MSTCDERKKQLFIERMDAMGLSMKQVDVTGNTYTFHDGDDKKYEATPKVCVCVFVMARVCMTFRNMTTDSGEQGGVHVEQQHETFDGRLGE